MVSVSHARCRQCGQARHKTARFNLCQTCWEKIKPSIRAQWKTIKERRRLRREVDAYVNATHSTNGFTAHPIQEELPLVSTLEIASGIQGDSLDDVWAILRNGTPDEATREQLLARIKATGVPPFGTPERALYMRLFVGKQAPDQARQELIARLYSDSDVPVMEIMRAFRTDNNEIARVRRRSKLPTREDMRPFRPKGHMSDNEELVVLADGDAMFRHLATGMMRKIWPEVAPEPEPEPVAEAAQEVEPVQEPAEEPRKRRSPVVEERHNKRYTPAQRAELMRLFADASIPLSEISSAYDVNPKTLYSMANRAGIRRRMPEPAPQAPAPEPEPAAPEPLAIAPYVHVQERTWSFRFAVTVVRDVDIAAPNLAEALRQLQEEHGVVDVLRVEQR